MNFSNCVVVQTIFGGVRRLQIVVMQHIFELLHKKKVKIENGIWIGIDFICWIDCSMCVLLLTGQRFKAICN